ncbi:hypothetical protein AWZ03_009410 [Drosophila navojoa]|uniref:Uncharacterized protein n=1 Tax=Drosophila navojoa TaxID=7232 RepID=A0A484B7Z1_DRONA|nr:hypothetical protein AWZ03_009410 [Drosophila navojoa]
MLRPRSYSLNLNLNLATRSTAPPCHAALIGPEVTRKQPHSSPNDNFEGKVNERLPAPMAETKEDPGAFHIKT